MQARVLTRHGDCSVRTGARGALEGRMRANRGAGGGRIANCCSTALAMARTSIPVHFSMSCVSFFARFSKMLLDGPRR
eukprot:9290493-Pyramimonas_sp.AAC.1